jgi:hypothetical protein
MANGTGSISLRPDGMMTFTDGSTYRVTIPTIQGAHSSDQTNPVFHLYQKDVQVSGMTPYAVQNWVINNPTANSVNNPATPYGAPNDATPGFGYRLGLAYATFANNDVRTYTAINELTGGTVVINVTELSHRLHFGAVVQIVRELPNVSITVT